MSSEANRQRRRAEAETEFGDLDVKFHLEKWVKSSQREELRQELKVWSLIDSNFFFIFYFDL